MATLANDPLLDFIAEIERRRRRSWTRQECREFDRMWTECARPAEAGAPILRTSQAASERETK